MKNVMTGFADYNNSLTINHSRSIIRLWLIYYMKGYIMKQVRKSVFETNSSSTHSLLISGRDEYDYEISAVLEYGEYGWGFDTLVTPTTKAEYLLTLVQYQDSVRQEFPDFVYYPQDKSLIEEYEKKNKERDEKICEILQNHRYTRWILESLKEVSGMSHSLSIENDWYPTGYIDHQSLEPDIFYKQGIYLFDMDEKDFKNTVKEIVFNKSYVIYIDNDN